MFNRLQLYTVHRKQGASADETVFVKEGFDVLAFVFTIVWAFYHRLWWAAGLLFIINAGLMLLGQKGMLSEASLVLAQLGVQVIAGFAAGDWRRAKLKRQGYLTVDVVAADSKLRAEQRFFERFLAA